jgi:hypothetical protein
MPRMHENINREIMETHSYIESGKRQSEAVIPGELTHIISLSVLTSTRDLVIAMH